MLFFGGKEKGVYKMLIIGANEQMWEGDLWGGVGGWLEGTYTKYDEKGVKNQQP